MYYLLLNLHLIVIFCTPLEFVIQIVINYVSDYEKQIERNHLYPPIISYTKHASTLKMKPEKRRLIKKKIKKIIHIIFISGDYLSSPHNTNQYLLTKHQIYETSPKQEGKAPGSMLQFLLNEEPEMTKLSQQEKPLTDYPSHIQNAHQL